MTMSSAQSVPEANALQGDNPQLRKRVVSWRVLVLSGVGAAAALGYATISWLSRDRQSSDNAQVDADVLVVSAQVSGTAVKVYATDHQHVKKGDLLVELDMADLGARQMQAEAELEAARAQEAAADAQVRIVDATSHGGLSAAKAELVGSATEAAKADAQVGAARAAVLRAKAEAGRADSELARAEALLKDHAIPQASADTARTAAEASRASLAQAEAELTARSVGKRAAQASIAVAQGRFEQSAPVDAQLAAAKANASLAHARSQGAEAALAMARLQLAHARITAPTDGVLSRLAIHEGQLVQAGQRVVSVVSSQPYVIANFKETQVGRMRAGQPAEIIVDTFPGRSFQGRLESVSPGTGARFSLLPPDNASGNYVKVVQRVPVKIALVDPPAEVRLAAGLSADVTVTTR